MNKKSILCSIGTRGRYDTTLPLAINAVIMQTLKPDKLVVFDDNESPIDVREKQLYQYLFSMLDEVGIEWEWIFAEKKGTHYNHQKANQMGYTFVWRVDDDCIPESNVLENLYGEMTEDVGGVGGSILTPPFRKGIVASGKIEDVKHEENLQWDYIKKTQEVDHLHCSFLYRAGIVDYNLSLSRVAFREETLFTYALKQKGYKLLITPAVTWHLKNKDGGIRDGHLELFRQDEAIFNEIIKTKDRKIVVLDNGIGDHIVFKDVLKDMNNPLVYSCFPDIIPGKSIAEAKMLYGSLDEYNIYRMMDSWKWKGSLDNAFRKLYNVPAKSVRDRLIVRSRASSYPTPELAPIIIAPYAKAMRNGERHPKNYPYWAEVIAQIKNRPIIQIGIEGEKQLTDDFRKNRSMDELKELLNICATWISVDSFFQHFAWDNGVKGVAIFGQSDPVIFGHKENTNLLKDRKYLRANQFLWWEQAFFIEKAFVQPETVIDAVNKIINE